MAVPKSSPVALGMMAAQHDRQLTFSETLQALHALPSRTDLTPKARAAEADRLAKVATAMGIDGENPFVGLVDAGVADAKGMDRAARLRQGMERASENLANKAACRLPSPIPSEAKRIKYDAAASKSSLGGANSVLAAQIVTGAYEPSVDRLKEMLGAQFDSSKVIDGHGCELIGARALIGTREDDRITMVGFRGTNNVIDAARDAALGCLDASGSYHMDDGAARGLGDGGVHHGFADHVDTVWPDIRNEILDAANHHRTVVITGHSLGAAAAQLAMARAVNDPEIRAALESSTAEPRAILETFAQPSVGDAVFESGFKASIDALGIPFHTYGYRDDPVMQVPPTGMPDAQGRTFVRPSATFAALGSGGNGASIRLGRPQETVKQDIRMEPAHFAADARDFVVSAAASPKGYSKLADHAPQNYFESLRELWKQGNGSILMSK